MKRQKPTNTNRIRFLAVTGIIAGLYTALSFAIPMLSFGILQCRFSEALTVLAVFTPAAIPGLTLGCILTNFIGFATGLDGFGILDIPIGSLATLLAALLTYWLGRYRLWNLPVLSTIPPVVFNALALPTLWTCLSLQPTWEMWLTNLALFVPGQTLACVVGGLVVAKAIQKTGIDRVLAGNIYTVR